MERVLSTRNPRHDSVTIEVVVEDKNEASRTPTWQEIESIGSWDVKSVEVVILPKPDKTINSETSNQYISVPNGPISPFLRPFQLPFLFVALVLSLCNLSLPRLCQGHVSVHSRYIPVF